MNIYADDKLFPFIEGVMLEGREATKVIKGARLEGVSDPHTGGKIQKLMLVFHGTGKRLILNKTNSKRIAKLYGPDTNDWRDQPITLYSEEVKAFGQTYLSVRVRETKPVMPADIAKRLEPVSDAVAQEVLD